MSGVVDANAERARLAAADAGQEPWRAWGPYVAERAWGTVREDYSENGTAWEYFPHDQARSRAYRWSEDGMAAICDEHQTFCLALALWNGVDPILKERMFGLSTTEGNHSEDVKEYWWYLDSTPTHSYLRWRYHYPQTAFPYAELVERNRRRDRDEPEYELADTGVFDRDRYWAVEVEYAKAAPYDLCMRITAANHGPRPATLHVLPTLWFRNTWAWGLPGRDHRPTIRGDGARLVAEHRVLGRLVLAGDGAPTPLCCDNDTNTQRLWGRPGPSAYPKDGINDHVVHRADTVNPALVGTKAALYYRLAVPAGGSAEIRLRLSLAPADPPATGPLPAPGASGGSGGSGGSGQLGGRDPGPDVDRVIAARRAEADEFFAGLVPAGATAEESMIVRQAVAGLMWSKQVYHLDVSRWLEGDPATAPPPQARRTGRNSAWWHMTSFDVILMPDPWEYPWYAAWDLAFHCVCAARVDPAFAKTQLLLLLREWYMHPSGQIPAYEWMFGDVNPPVQAWAALRIFELDGSADHEFLERVLHRLLINFTWWVNRKDTDGDNVFEGGFLGLDNVAPFDRSAGLPAGARLAQSDATAWMAMYALNLLDMALILAVRNPVYEDVATRFLEHFAYIAHAAYEHDLWDDDDGFFYDVLRSPDGQRVPLRVCSVVGLLPLAATTVLGSTMLHRLPEVANRLRWFLANRPEYGELIGPARTVDGRRLLLLSMVGPDRLIRILRRMLAEDEFLSGYGLRSLSRRHADRPFGIRLGDRYFTIGYEPGESTSGLFGGNSNWRGPIWFPINYLLIEALRRFGAFFGEDLLVEYPAGSGVPKSLDAIADDLSRRLVGLFTDDGDRGRPLLGDRSLFQRDPRWHDLLPFPEYFHGDTGAGLGAWHQAGWTALVADLIIRLRG